MAPNERRRQRSAFAADIFATGRKTRQRILQPAEAAGSDGIVASLDADNHVGSQAASCGGGALTGSATVMPAAAVATTQDGGVPMAASQTLARPGSQHGSQPGGEAANANQRPSMLCRHGRSTLQTIAGSPEPQPGSQSQHSEPPMRGSGGDSASQQQGELSDGASPLHGDSAAAAAGETDADADDADAAAGTQRLRGSPPQRPTAGTPARPCDSLAAARRILSSPLQLGWGRNPPQEAPHSPTHSSCSTDAAESDQNDGQEGVPPTQPVPPELFPPEHAVLAPSPPPRQPQGPGRSRTSQRSDAATGSQAGGAAGPPQQAAAGGGQAQSAFGALFRRPVLSPYPAGGSVAPEQHPSLWPLWRLSRQQQTQRERTAAHAEADTEAAAETAEASAHQRAEAVQEAAAEAGEARAEEAAEADEALLHDMLRAYAERIADVEEAMQEAHAEADWEDEADMAEAEEEDAADFAEAEAADAEEAAAAEAVDAAEQPASADATYMAGQGWLPNSPAEAAGAAAAVAAGAAAPTAAAHAAGLPAAWTWGAAGGRRASGQFVFPGPIIGGIWGNPPSPLYRASSNGHSGYLDYDVGGSQDTADRAADEEAELRGSPEPEDRNLAATDAAVRRAASAKEEAMLRDADRAAEEHWRAHQEEQEQMEWAIRTAERDAGEASDDEHAAEHRQEAALLRRAARLLEGSGSAAAPSHAELEVMEAAGLAVLRRCASARRQLQAAEAAAAAEQADEVAELRGRLTAAESQLKLAQVDVVNLTGRVNWWQDRADAAASANRQLQAQLDQAEAREQDANCAVCYVAARNASLLPCMHRFCIGCVRQHMSLSGAGASNCPLCRTRIRSVLEDI